jgi:hypothetical protein
MHVTFLVPLLVGIRVMVMNVLEEPAGSVFTGSPKMEAVCPETSVPTSLATQSQDSKECNFILIFCIFCALYHY